MRWLSSQDADSYLAAVGMKVDSWNRLAYADVADGTESYWRNYQAPKDAHNLFTFALHVAGWLSRGPWKILQMDNSSSFGVVQASAISRLLPGLVSPFTTTIQNSTCLFEFSGQELTDGDTELLIANVIYLFLLFEGHGYLVSANSKSRECLSIQDGFIYFSSGEERVAGAEALIRNFEATPLALPKWATEMEIAAQDRDSLLT